MLTQIDVLRQVIGALDRLKIPYMVSGSLAAAACGVSRSTQDADLVAALRPGDGGRLARELGGDFYLEVEEAEAAIRRRSSFSAIHVAAVFKVDIFLLSARPYDQEAFQRRLWKVIATDPSCSAFLQSPEDVVLAKLRWYRLGGEVSDQQWRDVLGVLKLQAGSLDGAYLSNWAQQEGVLDLLERACREAGTAGGWV